MLLPPLEERALMPPSLQCQLHGGRVLCVAEIGIYRCSESAHHARMHETEEHLATMAQGSERTKRRLLQHFADTSWTPWLYNQAVGWLRVYAYPRETKYSRPCVSGEYFAIDAKRLAKDLKRKRYIWAAEAFAVSFDEEIQTRHAFARISEQLQRWAQTEELRKLTLNLSVWENIGPHINWSAILLPDLTDGSANKPR